MIFASPEALDLIPEVEKRKFNQRLKASSFKLQA